MNELQGQSRSTRFMSINRQDLPRKCSQTVCMPHVHALLINACECLADGCAPGDHEEARAGE